MQKMRQLSPLVILLLLLAPLSWVAADPMDAPPPSAKNIITWQQLPDLPPAPGKTLQPGLAGAFVGHHNGVLMIAGGANFPEGLPWKGGQKAWHDDIFVLQENNGQYTWLDKTFKLGRSLAYGVSLSTTNGVLCVGGCDAQNVYADCFLLKWNTQTQSMETEQLPSLPVPLAFMAGGLIRDAVGRESIYIAGGQQTMSDAQATTSFYSLDLSKKGTTEFVWQSLPPWPGPARILPVAACQNDAVYDWFYLFSGCGLDPADGKTPLTDGYKWNTVKKNWVKLPDIATTEKSAISIMAGVSWPSGANHIIVAGGTDGSGTPQVEELTKQLADAEEKNQTERIGQLTEELDRAYSNFQGLSQAVYAYHTITDTWAQVGTLPGDSLVCTTAVQWPTKDKITLASGEIRPGVRTPSLWIASFGRIGAFRWLDYVALALFFAVLMGIGAYCSKKMHSSNDFFRAGQRIPWWAAALSIYAAQLSSISFMAIPAKCFAMDWRFFMVVFGIVAVSPIIVFCFLPFYRRLNITTAYEYLELRFNLPIRLIGSLSFMLMQLGRFMIVLYLPALAIQVVTGMDINISIMLMGCVCLFYAVAGGIEAVIWTDVIQVIVLFGGALLCLIIIPLQIAGGWNGMIDIADAANKFRCLDFRFDLSDATFLALFFGACAQNIITYGTDQAVIQRYMTTATEKLAARSIWISMIICIPTSMVFMGIGSALFAFYKTHPNQLNPALSQSDAIFPFFIVSQLPAGIVGLVIAALFAATMSTIVASMNSVSAAITTDFFKRLTSSHTEKTMLRVGRISTLAVGLIGILFTLLLAQFPIKSLWDQFANMLGLFGGGLGGLFLLGIFSKRTGSAAAFIALVLSAAVQYWIQTNTHVNVWVFALSGLSSCFIFGVLLGLVFPNRKIYSQKLTM